MKIYVPEAYSPQSLSTLLTHKSFQILDRKDAAEAEALLIRSHTKVTEKFLDLHPKLKFIGTATSGFDHIDWKACRQRGITATYCPEANAASAAEHTLFLILSLFKNANQQYRSLRGGLWREGVERGQLIDGKIIGVIGLGHIGQRVARLCQAFGARVIVHDPYQDDEIFGKLGVERKGFTEVLKEADLITFHVPLTTETRNMIHGSTLDEMSDEAFIVNASRGAVIEESELVLALRSKKIAGAALDVFNREPLDANSFLLKEPNLFLTPHTGAYTTEAWERASMEAVAKLIDFANGRPIADGLPLKTPWFEKTLTLS